MFNCRSSLYSYAKFLLMWHTQAPLQHDDLLPPFPHEPVGGLLLPPDPLGIVNRQLKLGISIKNFHLGSDCKPNQRFLFENYKIRKAIRATLLITKISLPLFIPHLSEFCFRNELSVLFFRSILNITHFLCWHPKKTNE